MLFVIIFFLLFALTVGLSILSALFGGFANIIKLLSLGRRAGTGRRQAADTKEEARTAYRASSSYSSAQPHTDGKIFGADEGVYVDFEEIKP